MKRTFGTAILAALAGITLSIEVHAQGTAFVYDGQLQEAGAPASGVYDLRFTVYDSTNTPGTVVAGPLTNSAVKVNNGLFAVTLDFGSGVFTGSSRWLQVGVRTNGTELFTPLEPRQLLAPVPYAIMARSASNLLGSLPATQLTGTIPTSTLPTDPKFYGTVKAIAFYGDGANLKGVNAKLLAGQSVDSFWRLGGNNVGNGQFVGSTNDGPLELRVGNQRALRLEPNSEGAPNIIGGSPVNDVSDNIIGATIAGGGAADYSGQALSNSVAADFGTVGGGMDNSASSFAATVSGGEENAAAQREATVAGGQQNRAGGFAATVGGGFKNSAEGLEATVGGGQENVASGEGATVAGGENNHADGKLSVISGGYQNVATNDYSMVPGGAWNQASGRYSFAAGRGASALNDGAFVWADSQTGSFTSTTNNQFSVRASGGVRFETSGAGLTLDGQPVLTAGMSPFGLSIQPNLEGAPNVIEGAPVNFVSGGVLGATVGGGGAVDYSGSVVSNSVTANFGTVGGGEANLAGGTDAVVSGGYHNTADGVQAVVAGGDDNSASGAQGTVGGGVLNHATGPESTVGGGIDNTASALGATVPGGGFNLASANYSFAAGYDAQAINTGAFVWADSHKAIFTSTNNDSFNVRAQGGVRLETSGAGMTLDGHPVLTIDSGSLGLRIEQNTNGWPNMIAGSWENDVSNGVVGATISGGGGSMLELFGPLPNSVSADFGTVGGGSGNEADDVAATVAGGMNNVASGYAATVAGGEANVASGSHSMAIGYGAMATNRGAFVWSDSSGGFLDGSSTSSTADNQFVARASGGFVLYTSRAPSLFPPSTNPESGVTLAPGSGSWSSLSDRNSKDGLTAVNSQAVLKQVTSLPIDRWSYKTEPGVRHVGPMAQDFYSAFHVGEDDRHITEVDEGGVALAAIQGLNQKMETELQNKQAEINRLKQELEVLKRREADYSRLRRKFDQLDQLVRSRQNR